MIIGTIKKIIAGALKGVYKLLCVFNLQFALLVAVIGAILFLCGVFEGGGFALIVFVLVFICSIVLALVLTIRKILGLDKKKSTKSPVEILNQAPSQPQVIQVVQQPVESSAVQYDQQPAPTNVYIPPIEEKPKYFRVKQNPNYVMAEYSNRYELLQITSEGLKKIRTDYKK